MKRVKPAKATWIYLNTPESQQRLQTAYDHVFTLARQSLLRKQQIRHISLWMITKDTYGIMKELWKPKKST